MQWLFNNSQVVFLLLIVGFSVVSWVLRKLQEQSIKRRREQAEQVRQMEMLRTGRDPATGEAVRAQPRAAPVEMSSSMQSRMPPLPTNQREAVGVPADADAMRQRQLQELRRRARERARQSQGVMAAPPTISNAPQRMSMPARVGSPPPVPGGVYRPAPFKPAAPKPTQSKAGQSKAGQSKQGQGRPAQKGSGSANAGGAKPAPSGRQYQPGDGESSTTSVFSGTTQPAAATLAPRPKAGEQLARLMNGKSIGQSAFILSEVFGSPVSRRGDDRGFGPEGMVSR